MERLACSVLEENLERLKSCGVDPSRFAWGLRSAGIADEDVDRTLNKTLPAGQRWGDLVSSITKNSKEGLFQKFIDVLLQEKKMEELGKRMKGIALMIMYTITIHSVSEITYKIKFSKVLRGLKSDHASLYLFSVALLAARCGIYCFFVYVCTILVSENTAKRNKFRNNNVEGRYANA